MTPHPSPAGPTDASPLAQDARKSSDVEGVVERLESELAEMANHAFVPMELWDRFSNRVLLAAAKIRALEGERDEFRRVSREATMCAHRWMVAGGAPPQDEPNPSKERT